MAITPQELDSLREQVRVRYRASGKSADVLGALMSHNERALGYAESVAEGEALDVADRELLLTVTILHDVAKAETPLMLHAHAGSELAGRMLRDLGKDEGFVRAVERAVLCHMGPLPFIAEEARKYAERTGEHLHIPTPETRIERLFYDVDMLALIHIEGIEKVVVLRSTTPEFVAEDEALARENGTTREAEAYASALQSVRRARDTLFSATARRIADELVADAERHVAARTGARAG